MLYWNCCLIRTYYLVINEENCKSFRSNLRESFLTCHFGGVNSFKISQMCHILVYSSNCLRNHWQTIHFFKEKKHGKHYHTMIMPWIIMTMPRNMAAMPSSWHDHDHVSPWSWYDHGKIMPWQPCFSNPGLHEEKIKAGRTPKELPILGKILDESKILDRIVGSEDRM